MKNKLNSNIDLETMPTGTCPKGETDNITFQNQYGVLYAKRTGEAINVIVELQDGKVINRTIQPYR